MAQSERVAQLLESLQIAHRDRGKSGLALARATSGADVNVNVNVDDAVNSDANDVNDVNDVDEEGLTSLPPLLRTTLLMPGSVVELQSSPGRGGTSLALSCLTEALWQRTRLATAGVSSTAAAQAAAAQTWLCAIDPGRTLFGPAVRAMGLPLERLLVVAPPGPALWRSAVRALKSGVFCGAVVDATDVDDDPQAFVAVRRLGLAAEECGASVFVLTDERVARRQALPTSARARVGDGAIVVERHRHGKTGTFAWEPPRSPLWRFWSDDGDGDGDGDGDEAAATSTSTSTATSRAGRG